MGMEEINEKKAQQKKLIIAILCLLIGVGLLFVNGNYLTPEYQSLKTELSQTASIARNIASVENQKENYERILDESGKVYGSLVTNKDEYISYLGEITMANKLNINKMTVDDVVSASNQMYSMTVQVELQGELYNVKNLVQQLYDSEMVSRINSFSYRLQSDRDLSWMWRGIDDETLVPWWELSEEELEQMEETEELSTLCADDLLAHGTALCYLEVEFLGVGG